ncbi:MAG: serine dehydratase beta chain, partial [Stackebrandtia sp.]
MISAFDLFTIGIGPSSSHTVGPMRAAHRFAAALKAEGRLAEVAGIRAELFGSLGATGHGHGSGPAVLLGLEGEDPESVDTTAVAERVAGIRESGRLRLLSTHPIDFDADRDLVLHRRRSLPFHPNGMTFTATGADGSALCTRTYYSVGGGFVVNDEGGSSAPPIKVDDTVVAYPFTTGAQLLKVTSETG